MNPIRMCWRTKWHC